jgi:hypothetical protein
MASACKPGPLGRNPEVQDLNDGTLFRGLSPLPGPIGVGLRDRHGSLITAQTSDIDHLLEQLRAANNGIAPAIDIDRLLQQSGEASDFIGLQKIIFNIFGSQCFTAGVIVGIGEQIISDAADLIKLCWTLLLADLHDLHTGKVGGWRVLFNPTFRYRWVVAAVAGQLLPDKLREAAEERDALIRELTEALKDPQELLVGMARGVSEGLQRDWQDFNKHMEAGTLEGEFKAGRIFGQVLVAVIGCITGIYAAARTIAKLGAKLPRLLELARRFKKKPDAPGGGGQSSSGAQRQVPQKQQQQQSPHKPSKDQIEAQKRQQAAHTAPQPKIVQQDIKDPNKTVGSGRDWDGIGPEPKWGNPKSEKAYGHSESEHGPKRKPQQLIDRANTPGESDLQGQWYNEDWVLAEQAAPKHPGRYVIDFERPVGRVWHKDGTATENVTRAYVHRNGDGTLKTSYPVSPGFEL